MREIRKDLPRFRGHKIALAVHARVAEQLLRERASLQALERSLGREIEVRAKPGLHQEQFEITAMDEGPPVPLTLRWLGMVAREPERPLPPDVAERVIEQADGDGIAHLEAEVDAVEATFASHSGEAPEEFSAMDMDGPDERTVLGIAAAEVEAVGSRRSRARAPARSRGAVDVGPDSRIIRRLSRH